MNSTSGQSQVRQVWVTKLYPFGVIRSGVSGRWKMSGTIFLRVKTRTAVATKELSVLHWFYHCVVLLWLCVGEVWDGRDRLPPCPSSYKAVSSWLWKELPGFLVVIETLNSSSWHLGAQMVLKTSWEDSCSCVTVLFLLCNLSSCFSPATRMDMGQMCLFRHNWNSSNRRDIASVPPCLLM